VSQWADTTPTARALSLGERVLTFGDLDDRSNRVANALHDAGVVPGSRVAYLGRNAPEFFEVLLGTAKAGCVTVPLNWRLAAPELEAIIADSTAVLAVVAEEFCQLLTGVRGVRKVVVSREPCSSPHSSYEEWISAASAELPSRTTNGDFFVLQMYTSGTTGKPKGVMSSDSAVAASMALLADVAGMRPDAVSLCTLPTFHIGGTSWTLAGLSTGCETVLIQDADPSRIMAEIDDRCVTTMIAVPTIIQRMVESAEVASHDLHTLETVYYGGGPMTSTVIRRAMESLSCQFIQGFGLTELPLVTVLPHEAHLAGEHLLRSCGRVAPQTEVRLVDPESGMDVPAGEVGEIWARSPRLMSGYWRQPEATAAVLDDAGWFRTGDAARRDVDGYLYIQDRIKDMIISGGENIFPAEVENVLMSHPAVQECAIIGVPSARWVETAMAIVVLRDGANADAAELINHCRSRLAGYKCPKAVEFVPELPRTASGKVQKFTLRSEFGPSTSD
jgi:long-chain acyl-CoA synthetase